MSIEGNGTPTIGELGRNIVAVRDDLSRLDDKVQRYAELGVERRLAAIEELLKRGQERKSGAGWQVASSVVATVVAGVLLALILSGGVK